MRKEIQLSEAVAEYDLRPGTRGVLQHRERLPIQNRNWHRCNSNGLLRSQIGETGMPGLSRTVRERRPPLARTAKNIPEALLHSAWRRSGAASADISGRDGHRYRVIYPGRPADGAGPDFRDAILERDDGVRIHGHVEIHVRSADWHSHGHGTDSAYNGVAMHVVLEEYGEENREENGPPVETQSGRRIPLLVLRREYLQDDAARLDPDVGDRSTAIERELPVVSPVPLPMLDMDAAGDEWFRNRSHGCAMQIACDGADQALWEGALECLGYPGNKKGFRQLASRLDWKTVSNYLSGRSATGESMARDVSAGDVLVGQEDYASKESLLTDLFLWAGGFGPKPAGAPRLAGKTAEWRARHGRPANHPRVRIRAAAAWALRWFKSGGPESTFVNAVATAVTASDLASIFIVPSERGRNALLGRSRARDIVVNHLLPSVHALVGNRQVPVSWNRTLTDRTKCLFDEHPLLASNSITREASRLLVAKGANGTPRGARQQQGLIHIYRMTVARQHSERQLPLL